MTAEISTISLPTHLRRQIAREALAALPRECCGLIEGMRNGNDVHVLALHPTANLAQEADRFEIDPAIQFRLARVLRGTGREIVGCYHSHPNGRAEPSPRDAEFALENDFVWLIAATAERAEIAAWRAQAGGFAPMRLVDTVTV